MSIWFYISLAMVGAVCMNFGFILQKKGVHYLPKLQLKGFKLRSVGSFFTSKMWVMGLVCTVVGWGLYLIALSKGPVSIIQPSFAFGLVVLAVIAFFYLKEHIKGKDVAGIMMIVFGIILLGLSTEGGSQTKIFEINTFRMIIFSSILASIFSTPNDASDGLFAIGIEILG
ncbi:MAG: EamA family transporter [Deltaproteobacteria bacterium]|nr:EamA family transporter [Deltaproteobacteria bacterium]